MVDTRTPRESQNREKTLRPQAWRPPELLPEVDQQPGYKYRWIRVSTLGKADPRNHSMKLREGWEPVPRAEQPQMDAFLDPGSRFKDNIEVDGLLLCKTPQEYVQQRNDYYANESQRQSDAVDNSFMRESDSRMPLFSERKSEVKFGQGK